MAGIEQEGTGPSRDACVDLLRGVALLCIFVDHVPGKLLGAVTLRNLGFSDAAELFVLLAGYSSTLAYSRVFERDGSGPGLRRIAARCLRLYAVQVALVLAALAIVAVWTGYHGIESRTVKPLLDAGSLGLVLRVLLAALPPFLDILPLYTVLLGAFPLVHIGLRRSMTGTLAVSFAL